MLSFTYLLPKRSKISSDLLFCFWNWEIIFLPVSFSFLNLDIIFRPKDSLIIEIVPSNLKYWDFFKHAIFFQKKFRLNFFVCLFTSLFLIFLSTAESTEQSVNSWANTNRVLVYTETELRLSNNMKDPLNKIRARPF